MIRKDSLTVDRVVIAFLFTGFGFAACLGLGRAFNMRTTASNRVDELTTRVAESETNLADAMERINDVSRQLEAQRTSPIGEGRLPVNVVFGHIRAGKITIGGTEFKSADGALHIKARDGETKWLIQSGENANVLLAPSASPMNGIVSERGQVTVFADEFVTTSDSNQEQ